MPQADPAQRVVSGRDPGDDAEAALQRRLQLGKRDVGRRFNQMTAEARATYDQQRKEEEQQRAAESDARQKTIGAGVAALEGNVLPVLERARAAFAEERIEARIKKRIRRREPP